MAIDPLRKSVRICKHGEHATLILREQVASGSTLPEANPTQHPQLVAVAEVRGPPGTFLSLV